MLENNTVAASNPGIFSDGGSVEAVNNLLTGCVAPATGTFEAGTDYNATDNAAIGYTVTGGGNANDRVGQTFTFVAPGDYHLDATDTGALDQGTSGGLFPTDIDGQDRAAPWDIGADEYVP